MPRVYLAGPPYAEEYRRRATELCEAAGWEVVDPMRRDFRGGTEGHETEITGNDIFEFDENGKVVDHWHEADHLLLYQQVGGEIRPKSP